MSFYMIQQHWWLILSALHATLDSMNAAWCQDYSCNDQVVTSTEFYDCAGYWSCSGSTITLTGNGADCEGSHSCVGTNWVIKGNDKELKCRGLYSCLNGNISMNDVSGYYDLDSAVGCYAEQSCLNSSIIADSIECTADTSCANANIKAKSYLLSNGYTSTMNSEIECYNSSTNECDFIFSAYFSGYNASIICGNGNTCNVYCHANACYGLTAICDKDNVRSTNCTINTICDVTGDNSNGICGNQGTIYPNNIYPILDNFQIPLLTDLTINSNNNNDNNNNIYSGNIDSIYSRYSTNYDRANTTCSAWNPNSDVLVCPASWDCMGDSYGWYVTINITGKEYTGICCQGSYSCTWGGTGIYDSGGIISNDYTGDYDDLYTAWRCDGFSACGAGTASWKSDTNNSYNDSNITNAYPIYIYLCGESAWPYEEDWLWWMSSYLYSDTNYNNDALSFEIFVGGDSAGLNSRIEASHDSNIYCTAYWACAYIRLYKINNVYGVVDGAMEGINVDSMVGSFYCLAIDACGIIAVYNMINENSNVYAFGYHGIIWSSFTNVRGSVIGYGIEAIYESTLNNIGGYIMCIGNYSCDGSTFNGVSKGIIAHGYNALSRCTINTNYNGNSSVNTNVTIRINGTNNNSTVNINCNNLDYCNLYCESQYACTKVKFYCQWDNCYVECNNTGNGNNYDCPDIIWTGTRYPTIEPSEAPTQPSECNSDLQTEDTYMACLLLTEIGVSDYYNQSAWREKNYCISDVFSDYFECFDDSTTIKTIRLNNLGIESQLTHALISLIPPNVTYLDLSNNNFGGAIVDWSTFTTQLTHLETLKLNNNQFSDTIDVSSLSKMNHLKHINLANNKFTSVYGFSNLETMTNLEQLYLENNEIVASVDLSYLPNNNNFTILHCYNNSLYGNLVVNNIPVSLTEFICGDNDFGIIEWTVDEYSSNDYLLTTLDLSNSNLGGTMTMDVFDITGGEFSNLKYIIMNNNPWLELEIDFEHLSGSNIELFSFLNVDTDDSTCEFGYLTTFITIKLDTSVVCDSSYCEDNNNDETVSWYRNNDTCIGKSGCEATCECVTPYEAGLETYEDSGIISLLLIVLLIAIGVLSICFCFGWFHSHGYVSIANGRFKRRDDFLYRACFSYLFQLWDFFSDFFLCLDIWDHYYQESVDSPDKNVYFTFWVISAVFVIVPWLINLIFLMKSKSGWQKGWIEEYNKIDGKTKVEYVDGETGADADDKSMSALLHAQLYSNHWISRHAQLLVLLCMLSGGLSPSLKLVNSKLFGLEQFNMGLPKYKQDEATRHRLWLTVFFENVPQIIIGTLYATVLLGEFDTTVLFALGSSVLSVIFAFVSFKLRFPKHHYIYELKCILKKSEDKSLLSKLRQTNKISNAICEGMNQDGGYIFVENVFKVTDSSSNTIVVMNIVCHDTLSKIDIGHELNIIDKLETKAGIWCKSIELNYIKHEIINLLTFQDMINYICGKNNKSNVNINTKIEGGIKSTSVSPAGSPRVASAMPNGNETENENNNNNTNNSDKNRSFKSWSVSEVYEWFESIVLTKDEFKDKKEEIVNFKLLLSKHMINGELIDKMINNPKYFDIISQKLSNDSECAALVFEFEENVRYLATK